MTELIRRGKIEFAHLRSDGIDNSRPAVAGVHAPKAARAVEDRTALGGEIMALLGRSENTRVSLERTIFGKRHPIGIKAASRFCFSRGDGSHGRRPLKEGKVKSGEQNAIIFGGRLAWARDGRAADGKGDRTGLLRRRMSRAEVVNITTFSSHKTYFRLVNDTFVLVMLFGHNGQAVAFYPGPWEKQ